MATEITVLVAEITNIRPHPNADKLELSDVNGWQLVIGKGKYKNGDKIIYIPIDSLIPDIWATKWGVKPYLKGANSDRVGQVRLRGEASFGLAVDIPEDLKCSVGDNVAEHFGITKYEEPIKTNCGDAGSDNPLVQRYTDLDNLRHFPKIFEDGEEIIATEKIHGCLESNTKIITQHGTKTIKDICDTKYSGKVLSFNTVDQVMCFKKITNHFVSDEVDDWYEIELENGDTIIATSNHKFWLQELNCWRQLKDLKIGDDLTIL